MFRICYLKILLKNTILFNAVRSKKSAFFCLKCFTKLRPLKQFSELNRPNKNAKAHCFYVRKTRFWFVRKTGGLPAKIMASGKKTLKTMIADNHSLSTRKAVLHSSQTLILTVLHDDLDLKPYKFHNWLI
jgi:hypothetical protein